MIEGKTKSGFAFSIDPAVQDDMELLDAIAEADENPLKITNVLKRLLGEEQKKALYEHLRDEKGHVSIKAVSQEIVDIFNSSQQGKN